MYFRPMPDTFRYWVADGDLCLGPADQVPAGATSWSYGDATRDKGAVLAFFAAAEAAGVPAETIADIKREQQIS